MFRGSFFLDTRYIITHYYRKELGDFYLWGRRRQFVIQHPTRVCLGGQVQDRTLDLGSSGRGFESLEWNPGHAVNTHVPVTKQYNLVPAAGMVTVGLASHWPRVTDTLMVLHLRAQGIGEGDEHPPTLS